MFDFQRLSKEDYEYMGKSLVWTYRDTCILMTSFEMETSGAYGESDELIEFNRLKVISGKGLSDQGKVFNETHLKWDRLIEKATLYSDKLLYVNVPKRLEPWEEMQSEGKVLDSSLGSFARDEFLQFLMDAVDADSMSIDLELLNDSLLGNGNAPERFVTVVLKEVLPKDYHKKLANKRHKPAKPKKEAFWEFLIDDLSGDCTCTKRQASGRIFKDKYRNDENYLKKETGYGLLMMKRKVSESIKVIEAENPSDYNRHENTEGFSLDNIPPCKKHNPK